MSDWGGIRAAFLTAGIEEAASAYMADCRQVLLTSDPKMTEVSPGQLVQAMMSLSMQRSMHWASLHRGEAENPDEIPGQALIGAFTGIGIALAMLSFDPENVLRECIPAMGRAYLDAIEMIASQEESDAQPVN